MTRYEQSKELYFDGEDSYEASPVYYKPKNIPQPYHPASMPVHPAVHVIFWVLVGVVGLALSVGATIVAANDPVGDEWTILVPLAYMIAAMYFFVKVNRS